ncbi:MAG: diaminopimelate epimerase [Bacillota bacterium]|nr:diaminopimelate epimerase [Bacillota bacterium]MDW7676201.1 diaminopimelate epimerase [Bacillota bacterium]
MKLHFIKCNPTENMTILVMDPVPMELKAEIANRLLAQNHLHAEQVGFVEKPHDPDNGSIVRLQMMGGEFCANAIRSLAAVLAFKESPAQKNEPEGLFYSLEVSGVQHPVDCRVLPVAGKETTFIAEARLPLPVKWEKMILINGTKPVTGTLVVFPGISHLIVNKNEIDNPEEFFRLVRKQLSDRQDDAIGVMFYDNSRSYMEPLVWVRATDTLYWERGCGSGTAAVGAVLAAQQQENVRMHIFQPGGALEITAEWKETLTALTLSGEVELVAEGTVYL